MRNGNVQFKLLEGHRTACDARQAVRKRLRKTVWMTPELKDEKLIFVCADASCEARLAVFDLASLKLPKY